MFISSFNVDIGREEYVQNIHPDLGTWRQLLYLAIIVSCRLPWNYLIGIRPDYCYGVFDPIIVMVFRALKAKMQLLVMQMTGIVIDWSRSMNPSKSFLKLVYPCHSYFLTRSLRGLFIWLDNSFVVTMKWITNSWIYCRINCREYCRHSFSKLHLDLDGCKSVWSVIFATQISSVNAG